MADEENHMEQAQEKWERKLDALSRKYEAAHSDPENEAKLDELNFKLSGLLGKNNRNLLREYTDRLIAAFNPEAEWYFKQGLEEGLACGQRICNLNGGCPDKLS